MDTGTIMPIAISLGALAIAVSFFATMHGLQWLENRRREKKVYCNECGEEMEFDHRRSDEVLSTFRCPNGHEQKERA